MTRSCTRSRLAAWLAAGVAAGVTTLVSELVAHAVQLGPLDDAFISLRYAAHWAAGRGLCFNPGETVEGYSNFLLVLLEAAAIRSGVDPVLALTLIGRAALAGLAALLAAFSFRHVLPGHVLLAIAIGSLIGSHPMLICWAHSGLEGSLHTLLVLGALAAALEGAAAGVILSAVCLVLAAMTRLETMAVFPVIALVIYWQTRSPRLTLLHLAVVILGFGAYFGARAAHFGYLFPNTFYAKLDYGSAALARRGALYVWDFLLGNLPMTVLALLACVLVRRAPSWVRGCLLLAAAELLGVVYVGGDHFAMFRFLVPVVPFLALAALYPAIALLNRDAVRRSVQAAAFTISLVVLVASGLLVGRQGKRDEPHLHSQFAGHLFGCKLAREWELAGRWLNEHTRPEATIATVAIGAVGFCSDRTIVDPHGIVDATIAHQRQELGRGLSGHEKYDVDQVLARRPDYILLVHYLTPAPIPRDRVAQAAWGDFNQDLVRRPELARGYRYASVPCGQLYLNLFVRRDRPALEVRP
jgi:arabinofuranosyltransferase